MPRTLATSLLAACLAAAATCGCARTDASLALAPATSPTVSRLSDGRLKSIADWETARPNELELAQAYEREGRPDLAEPLYRSVARKNPHHPLAYHRLGVVAGQQGRLDDAQDEFATARGLAPPTPGLLGDIAYTYFLQDQPGEAERYYRKSLLADPRQPPVSNNLGVLLASQGRYDESLAAFRRANSQSEAYALLAAACRQYGDPASARLWAQRTVASQPPIEASQAGALSSGTASPDDRPDAQLASYLGAEPLAIRQDEGVVRADYRPGARTSTPAVDNDRPEIVTP